MMLRNGQSLHRPLATAKHSFLTVDKQQSQDKLQMLLGLVQSTPPPSRRLICASALNPPRSGSQRTWRSGGA